MLGVFRKLPKTLYRVNNGRTISLRDYDSQSLKGRVSYDLHLHGDLVLPLEDSTHFKQPNGLSLRPDTPFMNELIRKFKSKNGVVFTLPEGLELPEELILYHEHSDHYSIQTTKPVTLNDFNHNLTEFFAKYSTEAQTIPEWAAKHPYPGSDHSH
eukprot:TRINITY_DN194_c0_g1_i1.p1 TRINITY_DN194_c0_g1~~TRINITY_DN194_c0_g1_i1.p1  ORF type:complete len:163 (-),score=9.33 TRINITY_DN194_c0_g1_i1:45-509(-)